MELLFRRNELLSDDQIIAPDFMVYEVANAVWRHELLLKDLVDGKPHISVLWGLIVAGKIKLISPSERLILKAYSIAKRNKITVYDALFISMAIELGVILKTFDKIQARAFEAERKRSNA